jgi:hypothetical protein
MLDATCIDGMFIPAPQHYCTSRASSAIAEQNKHAAKMSLTTKLLVLMLTATWLSGCATSASSPTAPPAYCTVDYQAPPHEIRRVALVTGSEPPIIEAKNLGHTRGENAAKGAAGGAALGAYAGLSTLPAAAGCGPLAPVCFGVSLGLTGVLAVGGAVVGTAVGVATGDSADTITEAEANTQAMLDSANLQTEVLQRAQDYGFANFDLEFTHLPGGDPESRVESQAYTGLPDESIDAVLELELVRISLQKSLEMESRTRLVSSRTGDVLSENKQLFRSEPRTLDEWTENNAAQLSKAIQQGLTVLAEDMIDESFSQFPLKGGEVKFASNDPENVLNTKIIIRRITRTPHSGKLGSEFSSDLLNIPEGKSAIFIYRPALFLDPEGSLPVVINDKYLFVLPKDGFDCLIVEPGMNTMAYPYKLRGGKAARRKVVRDSVETNSNEIAYLSVSPGNIFAPVSIESVIEKEAVDSLRANRRAEIQVINQN